MGHRQLRLIGGQRDFMEQEAGAQPRLALGRRQGALQERLGATIVALHAQELGHGELQPGVVWQGGRQGAAEAHRLGLAPALPQAEERGEDLGLAALGPLIKRSDAADIGVDPLRLFLTGDRR